MNRADIAAAIAEKVGLSKAKADETITAFLEQIHQAVAKGEEVRLPGFGSFLIKETAERQGRNPATGAAITIAASRKPAFKAAKAFSDAVNGKAAAE